MVKEFACSVRDLVSIPESGRSPGEGNGNPLQYSCLENLHGQRSLLGYRPWGYKEPDTTERLSMCTRTHTHTHTPRISRVTGSPVGEGKKIDSSTDKM